MVPAASTCVMARCWGRQQLAGKLGCAGAMPAQHCAATFARAVWVCTGTCPQGATTAHRSRSSTARSMAVANGCHSSNVITCGCVTQDARVFSRRQANMHACVHAALGSTRLGPTPRQVLVILVGRANSGGAGSAPPVRRGPLWRRSWPTLAGSQACGGLGMARVVMVGQLSWEVC